MGEVETQPVRVDQGAGLTHARAEVLAQGGVEQMGGGVVALGRLSLLAVYAQFDAGAHFDRTLGDLDLVNRQFSISKGVQDAGFVAIPRQETDIADLSARLRVEGSLIEHRKTGAI